MSGASLLDGATRWLFGPGRATRDAEALLREFSKLLGELGLPLDRATTHAPTLHPSYRWVMRVWRPDAPVESLRRAHGIESTPTFSGNTVEHVVATGAPFRARLDCTGRMPFPVLDELRADGLTDYLIVPLPASSDRTGAASWATARRGGFSDEEIADLTALADPFSLVFELKSGETMLHDVLAAYVGGDPATSVLAGHVRRGDVRRVRAAMMLTDMRGFAEMSDGQDPERVVGVLNKMFDAIVPAVEGEGGEVLKYLGDGLLAVFDASAEPEHARLSAYRAATRALKTIAGLPRDRPQIGIALHIGEVAYGNIGSGDRLDFTVIGRDVNVLARVEAMCKVYGRPLLATGAFVEGLSLPLEQIDVANLRGFSEPHSLFG